MDILKTSLGDMELFVELAKLGSLREVARSRQIEVAQLSRSLRRFEDRVGKRLFERSPRGLLLTSEGLAFRISIEKILEELGLEARGLEGTELKSKAPLVEGIGAPSFLMNDLVLPLVGGLKQRKMILGASIVELPPDRLVLSGLRGIVMMGFHAGKLEWPRSWVSERVGTLKWGLFGAKKFFPKNTLSVSDVMKNEFVYPVYWSPEGLRDAEDRCPLLLRHRRKGVGVSSGWMALEILDRSPTLSYLPTTIVGDQRGSRFVEIEVEGWESVSAPVFVSAHADRISKKLFSSFVDEGKKILSRS